MWSSGNWAQLEDGGWVSATQIDTDLAPIAARFCPKVASEGPPVEVTITDDYYPTPYFYRYRRHLYTYPYDPFFFGKTYHGKVFHGKVYQGKVYQGKSGVVHSQNWSGSAGKSIRTFSGSSGIGTKSLGTSSFSIGGTKSGGGGGGGHRR